MTASTLTTIPSAFTGAPVVCSPIAPYRAEHGATIFRADSLELVKQMEDNSVDSLVCDPPYELGMFGASWDKTGIAYSVELWTECLRVLKPGGMALVFGATRTIHRVASALEDAGFELRDQITWIYGQGFPKNQNVGSSIAKSHPGTLEADFWGGWGTALKPAHEPIVVARKPLAEATVAKNVMKWGVGGINIDESRVGRQVGDVSSAGSRTATFGAADTKSGGDGSGGWVQNSTGRHPANILLTHSPGCVEAGTVEDSFGGGAQGSSGFALGYAGAGFVGQTVTNTVFECVEECPVAIMNAQSGLGSAGHWVKTKVTGFGSIGGGSSTYEGAGRKAEDAGGASRFFEQLSLDTDAGFFYGAKPNKKERPLYPNSARGHLTVKPLSVMRYLINMVTPPAGVVFDPFAGSGTTVEAALIDGFQVIGCDLDDANMFLIDSRIDRWARGESPVKKDPEQKKAEALAKRLAAVEVRSAEKRAQRAAAVALKAAEAMRAEKAAAAAVVLASKEKARELLRVKKAKAKAVVDARIKATKAKVAAANRVKRAEEKAKEKAAAGPTKIKRAYVRKVAPVAVVSNVTPISVKQKSGGSLVSLVSSSVSPVVALVAPVASASTGAFLAQIRVFPLTENALRVSVAVEADEAKPFLQWVGGKREMITRYPELLPKIAPDSTYFEPFLGGGAMLFHLKNEAGVAVVNDSNKELVTTYVGVRDDVETVIGLLLELKARHSTDLYLQVRALDREASFATWSPAEVAARMIFLNQTCFNGLYRVNQAAQFNTSIGASLNRTICDAVSLRAAAQFLKGVTLTNLDFAKSCEGIKAGDFLFLDPPYVPAGGNADFSRYTKDPFTAADQVRVRDLMVEATARGAFVLATNTDTPAVRALYAGFHLTAIDSSRRLSSSKNKRGDVAELAITNYPIQSAQVAA